MGLEISRSILCPLVVMSVWSFVSCGMFVIAYGGWEDLMQWYTYIKHRDESWLSVTILLSSKVFIFSVAPEHRQLTRGLQVGWCSISIQLTEDFSIFLFNLKGTKSREEFVEDFFFTWSLSVLLKPHSHHVLMDAIFLRASAPCSGIKVNPWSPCLNLVF